MILDRVSAGKAKKKQQGRHVHGRIPYGYTSVSGELTPHVQRAKIVRSIFDEAEQGRSPAAIARMLDDDGVPAPQGGRGWSRQAVRLMLTNPVYAVSVTASSAPTSPS
jgi:hypothetical protein